MDFKPKSDTLIFVPTYNEAENIGKLFEGICKLGQSYDVLLLDDNSPDGTGRIIEEIKSNFENVQTIHRSGKLGIGSAHRTGILWAYQHKYRNLITMDADFTHPPEKIPDMLRWANQCELVVASRYLQAGSLKDWNLIRKFLTNFAHILLKNLLGLKQDATGAFRLYRLDCIPACFLDLVKSDGYSFFFESLYIIKKGGYSIVEEPIILTPRTYGHSKMSYREIWRSLSTLMNLTAQSLFKPDPWAATLAEQRRRV